MDTNLYPIFNQDSNVTPTNDNRKMCNCTWLKINYKKKEKQYSSWFNIQNWIEFNRLRERTANEMNRPGLTWILMLLQLHGLFYCVWERCDKWEKWKSVTQFPSPLQNAVIFKMTNAVCESYNKSWVDFGYCRLRAVSRHKVYLNVNATLLHPVNDVLVRGQLMKKANGYKPWLYSATFDGCQFIRRRNNPLIRLVWELFKEFSTINHTCPYEVKWVRLSLQCIHISFYYPIGFANG